MKRILHNSILCRMIVATAAAAGLCVPCGCIENDIPYPIVECRFLSIEAEGLSGEPVIDNASRRVTLPLPETTDIQSVLITDAELTEGAVSSVKLIGRHDLRGPERIILSLYQNYEWTLAAEQTIERSFTVEGQIGATQWDFTNRTVRVYVGFDDLSDIRITSLKLGPAGISTMSCAGVRAFDENSDFTDDVFRRLRDFDESHYRTVSVACHGRSEDWVLYVEHTDVSVTFSRIDGWVRTAWFYAEGLSGAELGFRYRRAGDEAWTEVPSEAIEVDGGAFSTRVRGLEPQCKYEAVAYSGDDETPIKTFTTEPELPLPNSGFEDWCQTGNAKCPYAQGDVQFWDTGNKGSTTLGSDYNITTDVPDPRPGSSGRTSAQLASRIVAGLKFAAGNIFTGRYASTKGTNGYVDFGRPFTSHPVALRGWVKFENGRVDKIGNQPSDRTLTTDDFDEGQIYIAVGTWTAAEYGGEYGNDESPVEVYSGDEKTFFNKNAKDVVGYGERIFTEPTDGWVEFEIPLDYRATNIVPTHLIIVCSASRWGDYFTGSSQNRMWVDDFELVWE